MDTKSQVRILVDTNVWLDRFIPGRSGAETAGRFFARCAEDGVMLLCPPHTIQDVFFQVSMEAKRWVRESEGGISDNWARAINRHAWDRIHDLQELATVAGMSQGDVWLAEKYRVLHDDFEDDLVIAVAQRVKADYLVTSDKQLIAKSPVAALTPADMLTVLEVRR